MLPSNAKKSSVSNAREIHTYFEKWLLKAFQL